MSNNFLGRFFRRNGSNTYLNSYLSRLFASNRNPEELRLKEKLNTVFPSATSIHVEDISGGCGSMYQIHVESKEFKGLNTVKQHQMITKALKDDIKSMHGVRITTSVPSS